MISVLDSIIGRAYNFNMLGDFHGFASLDYPYIISALFVLFVVVSLIRAAFGFISSLGGMSL